MGIHFRSKYVVGTIDTGHPLGEVVAAVVFQEPVSHHNVAQKLMVEGSVLGAGFCHVYNDGSDLRVAVYGESVSLKVQSRQEDLRFVQTALSLED